MTHSPTPARDSRSRTTRKLARITIAIAVVAVLAYLVVSAVAALQLSRPGRTVGDVTPAEHGLPYRSVTFPARTDETGVSGWYVERAVDAPAIVMVHGRNGSRGTELDGSWLEVADVLWRAGFSVLMIDLRGHGSSGAGRLTFGQHEQRDVAGAVDWLLEEGVEPGKVGLLGVSLGGAAALAAAADAPEVGAVITDATYADVAPIIEREWEEESGLPSIFLPSTRLMARLLLGFDPAAARPVEHAARLAPRPLFLIHGSGDRLVPPEHAHHLQQAHGSALLWMLEDVGHADAYLARPDKYAERITSFFRQALHP